MVTVIKLMTGCHFLLNLSIFWFCVVSMYIRYLVVHTKLSAIDKCIASELNNPL